MAIGTTTALLASAAIGAGSQVLGSKSATKANNQALQAQQSATDSTNATNLAIYNQNRNDQAPWRQAGEGALGLLSQAYGIPMTPSAQVNAQAGVNNPQTSGIWNQYINDPRNQDLLREFNAGRTGFSSPADYAAWHYQQIGQNEGRQLPQAQAQPAATPAQTPAAGPTGTPDYSGFYKSPDYQFRLDEGMKALNARNAALGMQDSGAAQKAAIGYAGNLASGEFNNYANRLAALAGVGQTATQASAGAGTNYANQVSQANQQQAQSLSSSYANQGAINGQLIGGIGGIASGLLGNANMFGGAKTGAVPNWNQLALQGGWS